MRVAPEGRPFIGAAFVLLIGFAFAGWWIVTALWAPIAIWVVAFFRDPERVGARGDHLVIANADPAQRLSSLGAVPVLPFSGGACPARVCGAMRFVRWAWSDKS